MAAETSKNVEWVVSDSTRTRRGVNSETPATKLLFNKAVPASARNRATLVHTPMPILIERLLPSAERSENSESAMRSSNFTVLSEERLEAAVKLAKRDLRRRRLTSPVRSPVKSSQEASHNEITDEDQSQERTSSPSRGRLKTSTSMTSTSVPQKKTAQPIPKQTSQKLPIAPKPVVRLSPPTRGPVPHQAKECKPDPLSQEILKLQIELAVYIQKVEELTNRGKKTEELLEPEEEIRLEMRREKHGARSLRVIYVLQQQVKEIKEDMEKLRGQDMFSTKKSAAINRLAAAHRGAIRALQDIVHQLSDLSVNKMPPYHKELGRLIHQLALCSAEIEVDQCSAVPRTVLDILQKLEVLDHAINKREMLVKAQAQVRPHRTVSPSRILNGHSTFQHFPGASNTQGLRKPAILKKENRPAPQKPKTIFHQPPMSRREVLRVNLETLARQRGLTKLQERPRTHTVFRRGGQDDRPKAFITKQGAGFRQPTVSSRLRVNELPQRECSVPWIPASPHSPPLLRRSPPRSRPEPRCLFSPEKPVVSPPRPSVAAGFGAAPGLSCEKKNQAQNEAVRNAWLEKMTTQRLKALNQLSREEDERIQKLRSEVVSPTEWAARAEQEARERIQPLLDEAQQIGESRSRMGSSLRNGLSDQAAERLTEGLLDDLVEDTARAAWAAEKNRQLENLAQSRLQAPTLESMLLRMEEIQRDEDEVRRRVASITYSDPLYWDQRGGPTGPQGRAPGSRPVSPQPIRISRPELKQSTTADILLEKPVETGYQSVDSPAEEAMQVEQGLRNGAVFPASAKRSSGTITSVPGYMLKNIRQYREDYDAYLQAVAHESVGSFNPWLIANSLADELLSEALTDVAAEFQDVVEEYAEAVFTSEFLKPAPSPPAGAAAAALVGI